MVAIPYIWRQSLHIQLHMRLHLSVSQECKAVLVFIPDIIILESWFGDRFQKVDCLFSDTVRSCLFLLYQFRMGGSAYRSRPKINSILNLPVFEPTSTLLLPNSRLMKLVKMGIYIIQRLLLHIHTSYCLRLNLAHHLHRILNARLNAR